MDSLTLIPFGHPFDATITPPGSKSLTNRALVLAALADGESHIENVLLADDTEVMLDGLARLGFRLAIDRAGGEVSVHGEAGRVPAASAELSCGNSGTTIRFLAALCSLGHGEFRLDGEHRMRERPIAGLVDLLRDLGVSVDYSGHEGMPPIVVHAAGIAGGPAEFRPGESSQYLSAALMAAPYAADPVSITTKGRPTSRPYVEMTLAMMRRFGAEATTEVTGEGERTAVAGGAYTACRYTVEPDASAATYFMAAAAVSPGSRVTIGGLGSDSLQGDVAFARVLEEMGAEVSMSANSVTVRGSDVLRGIERDMADMPDAAMTLAVVAVFASGPTVIRGLHTLPLKETDRIAALTAELVRLGASVDATEDTLVVAPPAAARPAEIETYGDHRMAMSFAVAGTRVPGITIMDPGCTAKTYPGFWDDLEALRGPAG